MKNHRKIVYLLPGMASRSKIFKNLDWGENFHFIPLEWTEPLPNENIEQYAQRMSEKIHHHSPILLGVSFGGIIAQEISKFTNCEMIILISSVKSHKEIPFKIRIIKYFKLYRILPLLFLLFLNSPEWILSKKLKKKFRIYNKYLGLHSKNYLQWSLKQLSLWSNSEIKSPIIHIQGDKDYIFPIKNIANAIRVYNADHLLILFRFRWINQHLPQIILKKQSL